VHETLEQVRDRQVVQHGLVEVMAKLDVLFNRLVITLIVTGG
jgi:hypothetical protein